ncbi:hypothetical protein MAR_032018, partial [Mya arenaria]
VPVSPTEKEEQGVGFSKEEIEEMKKNVSSAGSRSNLAPIVRSVGVTPYSDHVSCVAGNVDRSGEETFPRPIPSTKPTGREGVIYQQRFSKPSCSRQTRNSPYHRAYSVFQPPSIPRIP